MKNRLWCRLGFHSYESCLDGYTCRIWGSAFRRCIHCHRFQSYRRIPVSNDCWGGYSSESYWMDWFDDVDRLFAVCARLSAPADVFHLVNPSMFDIDILKWLDPIESGLCEFLDADSYHLVFLVRGGDYKPFNSHQSFYLASASDILSIDDFDSSSRVVFSIKKSFARGFAADGRLLVSDNGAIVCFDSINQSCNPYDQHAYWPYCYGKLSEYCYGVI